MGKLCSMWASSDRRQTIAEKELFIKLCSNSSRVETRVSWSTVPCDESSMVSRAERLFSCFYLFFIHQSSLGVLPLTSVKANSEEMSFGPVFCQMWCCSGNMIAQLALFWPSSWHVEFHFCLFRVNVKHIFFESKVSFGNGIS